MEMEMKHRLLVTLENPERLRLTWSVDLAMRTTPYENLGRQVAEDAANNQEPHAVHGPWAATHSRWEY